MEKQREYPVLEGSTLFRNDESVYINRSDELSKYCGVMHAHDFIEIAYVIEGTGTHIMGGHEYRISKGDLFVINTDVPHGFFADSDSEDDVPVVYNCVFMPDFLDNSLFSSKHFQDITSSFLFRTMFPDDFMPQPDLRLKGIKYNEIGDIFRKMYNEYKLKEKGYTDILRGYLIELIVKIFRFIGEDEKKPVSTHNRLLVEKAIDYLIKNYNKEIRLEDLAMKSFISKNYFSTLFKETAGVSFSEYIKNLRIDEACKLIRTTNMKITDIAHKVGYRDMKFFYGIFKKITGKTPGEYRKI